MPALLYLIRPLLLVVLMAPAIGVWAHDPSLTFVPNLGQWQHPALFKTGFNGGRVFLEEHCFTYTFLSQESRDLAHDLNQASWEEKEASILHGHAWKMHFVGSQAAELTGKLTKSAVHNYFLGADPANWRSSVNIHGAVHYEQLYPNIDLFVHSSEGNFKYDFWVEPGADAALIALDFEGLDDVEIAADGALKLATSIGEFVEGKPFAYQLIDGQMVEVACNYAWRDGHIGFELPEGFDPAYRLVIDPELIAATLSGTNGDDNYGHTATFDLEGNIYTGAISFGPGYPSSTGAYDSSYNGGGTDWAMSKLTPDGTDLIWANYIGGNSSENPHSMVANNLGELYVFGTTSSEDFPALSDAYQPELAGMTDMAIARISADGTELLGCSYIGGSGMDGSNAISLNYGDSYRGEIILNNNAQPVVICGTRSADFPVTSSAYQDNLEGAQDAVLVQLNANLTTLMVSTYLGGTEDDMGYGVRVSDNGDFYLCGSTSSANFPTTAGAYQTAYIEGDGDAWNVPTDAFVAVLTWDGGTLNASTYIGTEETDQAFFLDTDTENNIWIYGHCGADMPVVGDGYLDAGARQFVANLPPSLDVLLRSTTIGTSGGGFTDFIPIAFLVDACDNIYISSHSSGGGLEVTGDALYDTGGFYLGAFTPNAETLEFSTYYTSNHVDGGTSRFDKNGTVYQGVCSGGGFATTPGAWAENQSTGWDIGVFKIDFDVSGVNSAITGSETNGCAPFIVDFSNYSSGDNFFWDFGDGNTSAEFEPSHLYENPGVYEVSLIVSDSLSCNLADTSYFDVVISTPTDFVPSFTYEFDCENLGVTTENTTGVDWLTYEWDMGDGTLLTGMDVEYSYAEPGTYTVSLLAIDEGCENDSTVTAEISVYAEPLAEFDVDSFEGCLPFTFDPGEVTVAGATITWDFGDGTTGTGPNPEHIYETPGEYTLTITAEGSEACSGTSEATATVTIIAPPPIEALFEVEQSGPCEDLTLSFTNTSTGEDLTYDWFFDNGFTSEDAAPEPQAYSSSGTYYVSLTIGEDICDTEDIYTLEVLLIDELIADDDTTFSFCPDFAAVEVTAPDFGPGTTWMWQDEQTDQTISVAGPGLYTVDVTFNNCQGTFEYEVATIPDAYEVRQWTACEDVQTVIEINAEGTDYEWCTGEQQDFIVANEAGEYCYFYTDPFGCTQEGLVVLTVQDAEAMFYVPNAFTPNNDGINDVFVPVGETLEDYHLTVWNRWGEAIFESTDQNEPWIGNHQGGTHYVPDGMYTYTLEYTGQCSAEKVAKIGTVTLVR